MRKVKGLSKGSKRLLVVFCTLLLAGSTFLILGVTGWAQQQPAQSGGTTQAQSATTIEYWEPQVGTRTVYYTEDINDIHGQKRGAHNLGYFDIDTLYIDPLWPEPYQLLQSQYYNTTGISNMNPVYFDLVGPWYFRMTTPWKYIEEIIGIDQAPDAAQFPQATYAVKYTLIGGGGVRKWGTYYRSNDPSAQKWYQWGQTNEYFPPGKENSKKDVIYYTNKQPLVLASFPIALGSTGSLDVYRMRAGHEEKDGTASYNVVAQGKITVAAGTYDALMIKYDWTPSRHNETRIEYVWVVQGVGIVNHITSLPNELGPTFKEATDIEVMESQTTVPPQK